MTAVEFLAQRPDLPDGGRWTELIAGEPVILDPPDQRHGDVVLTLSKALAAVLRPDRPAFASFDLGVQTRRGPDTVRFPAVSVFASGDRFAQIDAPLAAAVPDLVVEIASQNDRRRGMADRVREYHALGVAAVWVADPHAETVVVLPAGSRPVTLAGADALTAPDLLPGLNLTVLALFAEPTWWHGKRNGRMKT